MRFFLDTEWADVLGADLISIGLISEDGSKQFYAERDPRPQATSDFVRHVVFPLLEGGACLMSDRAMTKALRAFLADAESPRVIADYFNDIALLQFVLAGFELPDEQVDACGPLPDFETQLADDLGLRMAVEGWFSSHAEHQENRHHALVDAKALRIGWLAYSDSLPPA